MITTCKGRLDHLKQTVPAMLRQGAGELILVDYHDPDRCGDWAEGTYGGRISVVRVELGSERFNVCHARNAGARIARGRLLAFVDADIHLDERWLASALGELNRKQVAVRVGGRGNPRGHPSKIGTCLVRTDAFVAVRGFDEQIDRFGAEDQDLYQRLGEMGRVGRYEAHLIEPIRHGHDQRNVPPHQSLAQASMFVHRYMKRRPLPMNPDGWGKRQPTTRGVLTAASRGFFPDLQLLVRSIRDTEPWPIQAVDLGLGGPQRRWCTEHDVELVPLADLALPPAASQLPEKERLGLLRPWFLMASPRTSTLWISADAVVLRPLSELFERVANGPFVAPEGEHAASDAVIGLRRGRDDALLERWRWCVERVLVSYDKPECLLWALRQEGLIRWIASDSTWNARPNDRDDLCCSERKRYRNASDLLETLRCDHPGAGIVRWTNRPKLWELLEEEEQSRPRASAGVPLREGTPEDRPRRLTRSRRCEAAANAPPDSGSPRRGRERRRRS